jgi:hypothetical protein
MEMTLLIVGAEIDFNIGYNSTHNGNKWDDAIESGDGIDANLSCNHAWLVTMNLARA